MFREAPRGLAHTAEHPSTDPFCSQLRRPTTISDLPRSRTDTRPSFLYLLRVARLPYEWRRLVPECLKRGIWEPEDRRVLVPQDLRAGLRRQPPRGGLPASSGEAYPFRDEVLFQEPDFRAVGRIQGGDLVDGVYLNVRATVTRRTNVHT